MIISNTVVSGSSSEAVTIIMSVIGFGILAVVTVAFGIALYQEWKEVNT